ncbi:DUF2116 family Zn-ribbon domain-containing protein [Niabella hibiscisoli]|uniref:DUF2116 family Zn-ribbon domain-containing protein n=1 Tax=Niabella hibiscisoli TaxID=1825928 RepID=UPI001F10F0BA|nr:DUF2116 family Zn-ribbon domain-containing protein [Niabella hibiscisoli]MCH5719728.1 DUF2116 family Zn-ribbon domain-containing protein [Niabella hibiscisoli]
MEMHSKNCLACGKPVKGRSDKKFCDDYCRNAYNNRANGVNTEVIRNINNDLKKNRQILASLLQNDHETVITPKSRLIDLGFKFRWMTHQYTNQNGQIYFYCYDYGYLPIENDVYLVVKGKEHK